MSNEVQRVQDPTVWESIDTTLVEMSMERVVALVSQLDIAADRLNPIVHRLRNANLTGLVLTSCDLIAVRDTLQPNLGDWTLIRLLIETLRIYRPHRPVLVPQESISTSIRRVPSAMLVSIPEQRRRLTVQTEVENEQQWLVESLATMDAIETDGDLAPLSHAPSVRFESKASSGDSTTSMFGSDENVLDDFDSSQPVSVSVPTSRRASIQRPNDDMTSHSSIRSSDQQLTVKRRAETEVERERDAEKIPLRKLFRQSTQDDDHQHIP